MQSPTTTYPIVGRANADVLYASMGSFWTQMFNEKNTIKGLAITQAEQIIQQYLETMEAIAAASVKDTPVFSQTRNYPLQIKRSDFGTDMPVFGDGSVFGAQPEDSLYEGVTFSFGQSKDTSTSYWSCALPDELKELSLVANRAIQPSKLWVANADVRVLDGRLYFRSNIFEDPLVTKFNVVDPNGAPVTFYDKNEIQQPEQIAVVWVYNAKVDTQSLFYNHGYVFDLFQPSSQLYKDILVGITKLFSNGPSVHNLKAICAAFLGVMPVVEVEEIVERVNGNQIVTNHHVYQFDSRYTVNSDVRVGAKFHAGDILVDAVQYFDQVSRKNWWQSKLTPKIASDNQQSIGWGFPAHLFVGGVQHELVFKNEAELLLRDADGYIHFPVEGTAKDVQTFNDNLNLNADTVGYALGLEPGEAIIINPLEFIFEHFLKNSSALVKLHFKTVDDAKLFTSMFPIIRQCLPMHVYFIFLFELSLASELYNWLDMATPVTVNSTEVLRNADGTDANGFMTNTANYKTDPKARLFSFAKGVPTSLLNVGLNDGTFPTVDLLVKDGELVGTIEEEQTTREINNLLLLGF